MRMNICTVGILWSDNIDVFNDDNGLNNGREADDNDEEKEQSENMNKIRQRNGY